MKIIRMLFAIAALLMSQLPALAQRGGDIKKDKTVYFWFYVKVFNKVDRITRLEEYDLRLVSPTVYNGNLRSYQRALWQGTTQGTKIAVGPFSTYQEAADASKVYKTMKDTTASRNMTQNLHWFLVKVEIMERSKSYQFERMAARVASGNESEFCAVLRESLGFKTLAIGPFSDEMEAEQAKSLYRIEE